MYTHVLVGTDGSPTASRAVRAAADLALLHLARLTIGHAFRVPRRLPDEVPETVVREMPWLTSSGAAAEALVEDAVRQAQEVVGDAAPVEGRIEPGTPLGVLRRLIDDLRPDVVVVGNADLTRLRVHRGIGPTLARRAPCDVVIVDTVGRRGASALSIPA